jgi:hypothetical protein
VEVTTLRGTTVTFAEAADAFRSTVSAIDWTIAHLGGGERRLADVIDDELPSSHVPEQEA